MAPRDFSAFGVSMVVHAIILSSMWMIRMNMGGDQPDIAVETVFADERAQQEFSRELDLETDIAETMNTLAGGVVSTAVGSAPAPVASKTKIETSESLKEPDLQVNAAEITLPSEGLLAEDLGAGEVTGDVGAVVSGYGEALGRITQELIRLMRSDRLLVVWLFDESDSMKDDQEKIREKFHEVYEELGIVQQKDEALRKRGKEVLLTSIIGFGKSVQPITPKPTSDINEIRGAIDRVPIDESGKENMCQAILASIRQYRPPAVAQKRKLVIIVVSDESGDDGQFVEETLNEAKKANAPIYVLGREAIFGYPYARIRWKDPQYGLWHWLRIRRGPETAFPECLQWDGLHDRWDAYSSGFGAYEQVRLAKESGGIFFMLPGEEENLTGEGANLKRRFEFLNMKEYQPLLLSRRDYAQAVTRSRFRKTIWDVIVMFNPNDPKNLENLLPKHDPNLNIREIWYPIDPAEFRKEAAQEVVKAGRAMALLNKAIPIMEDLKPLRAEESSQRWRANYDLALAQLLSFRVRLFQYLLAMDRHAHTAPKPKDPHNNRWNVQHQQDMLVPDEEQFKRVKEAFNVKVSREEYLAVLKQQEDKARALYEFVKQEHPGTPWAQRAQQELNHGFGMHFVEVFRDPNYDHLDIKLPNP